jgi:hypothetical protein
MQLKFKKRSAGRSIDEWTDVCMKHFGYTCHVDEKKYLVLNQGVLALDEPAVPGMHRRCIIFRDWAKKAIKDGAEWKIEQWHKSLQLLSEDGATVSGAKNTNDGSSETSSNLDWTQPKVVNALSEVLDPGMCASVYEMFKPSSSANEGNMVVFSEPLPPILNQDPSIGTASGATDTQSCPF